jgi:hypothetical protein
VCTVVLVAAAPGVDAFGEGADEFDGGAFPCELCEGQPATKSVSAITSGKWSRKIMSEDLSATASQP